MTAFLLLFTTHHSYELPVLINYHSPHNKMAGSFLQKILSNCKPDSSLTSDANEVSEGLNTFSSPDFAHHLHPTRSTMTFRFDEEVKPIATDQIAQKEARSESPSSTRSRRRRTSYDSIRETREAPQSFARRGEHARSEGAYSDPLKTISTSPTAHLCSSPPANAKRQYQGRRKSNSFSNPPPRSSLCHDPPDSVICEEASEPVLGETRILAPLERLPAEIVEQILWLLTSVNPNNEYASRYADLVSCLQVSRPVNQIALEVLYREVAIPHSVKFTNFVAHISRDPSLSIFVRRLDFSRYNNIGFGRTRQDSASIMHVTPQTLKDCLDRLPHLREFLVHEHIDDELDINVLEKAFTMPTIEALDFCACSSPLFTQALTSLTNERLSKIGISRSLQRLSLHECTALQAPVFEALLPRLHNLTHLDVAHTLITDNALWSIPQTARITHLNLGRCTRITGANVVRFVTEHAAVKDSLVFLSLMAQPSRHRLLSEEDVENLLPRLPSTLRSLNIGGARLNGSHMPVLRTLTRHLEELGLSDAKLDTKDLQSLFSGVQQTPCSLRYIDLTDVPSVDQVSLQLSKDGLATDYTIPLEVIELSESVLECLKKANKSVKNPDWTVRELGRRGWFVRQPQPGSSRPNDDGMRPWKMGARWWGMRKVPVAEQDVGGMYGFYAFKRI